MKRPDFVLVVMLAAWTRYFQQQRNAKLEFKMHRQTCLLIFLYKAYSFCQHALKKSLEYCPALAAC